MRRRRMTEESKQRGKQFFGKRDFSEVMLRQSCPSSVSRASLDCQLPPQWEAPKKKVAPQLSNNVPLRGTNRAERDKRYAEHIYLLGSSPLGGRCHASKTHDRGGLPADNAPLPSNQYQNFSLHSWHSYRYSVKNIYELLDCPV